MITLYFTYSFLIVPLFYLPATFLSTFTTTTGFTFYYLFFMLLFNTLDYSSFRYDSSS